MARQKISKRTQSTKASYYSRLLAKLEEASEEISHVQNMLLSEDVLDSKNMCKELEYSKEMLLASMDHLKRKTAYHYRRAYGPD